MRASRIVAVAALVALALGGCAPAVLPEGLSEEEAQAFRDEEARLWWEAIAPGEPMPVVEVVEYEVPGGPSLVNDCLDEADLDGFRIMADGSIQITDPETAAVFDRVSFVCSRMFPYRSGDTPEDEGMYSQAQLDYLLAYFRERLIPCLAAQGYVVSDPPETFTSPYITWSPYDSLRPQPNTEAEWAFVDVRCAPPPFGNFYRWGDAW